MLRKPNRISNGTGAWGNAEIPS